MSESASSSSQPYRHVVVFKFKPEATDDQIQAILDDFRRLAQDLQDIIIGFEHGRNISPEGLDQGFSHVFLVTFRNQADCVDVYLPHPKHKAFVGRLLPILEQPFVLDYVASSL